MFFSKIKLEFGKIIYQSYKEITNFSYTLVTPPNPKLGHLAFGCFMLAKKLQIAPEKIAETIVKKFYPVNNGWIKKINSQGAYLNLSLNYEKLGKILLDEVLQNPDYEKNNIGAGKKIVIEFSSPNTNKPLHLGHARNNCIGFSLSKILKSSGYKTIQANLINDRGIHICQSMLAYSLFGKKKTPQSEKKKGDHFVGDYYVLYHKKKKENPELEEQANQLLRKWEVKEKKVMELWNQMSHWALTGIQQTYQRCGIEFDKFYFESQTYANGKKEVEKALINNLCYKNQDGAILISLSEEGLGQKVLLRKDATAVYITQDIYTTIKKYEDYHFDECLFVVGSEQKLHFQTLFALLKKFGYQWADTCKHLSYGMIFLPEGKMKSREGKIVDLDNLLNEIQQAALQELQKRQNTRKNEKLLEVAEKITQAALKFFILKVHSKKDFVFDKKNSLSFEGNTGPYLQYTYARICSLLQKIPKLENEINSLQNWNEAEIQILQSILLFPSILEKAANEYEPSLVAVFTLEFCRKINKFYYEHPVLKESKNKNKRSYLLQGAQIILEKCFKILGIPILVRM